MVPDYDAKLPASEATTVRQQIQAHTHWINDIALAQSNQALISASSDITVKLWRPAATDGLPPQPIGLHSDYVKALAVPSPTSDWVASGGLDRKINIWDLNGGGQKMSIAVEEDKSGSMLSREKGSVYALAARNSVIASGGPEGIVRVWDARTGSRITKLVGHTDNIRDVLISQDGTTIVTASSDATVKVWSTIAGRCMFTLTMHDESVWSLFSTDPDLSVFYSSDRSGLVAKTDTRNTIEIDEGLSVAICQENEGVHKITAAGDCVWTATSRPSINRWRDANTDHAEIEIPDNYQLHRTSIVSQRLRYPSVVSQWDEPQNPPRTNASSVKRKIPLKHMLRLSNTAYFPVPVAAEAESNAPGSRRGTLESFNSEAIVAQPVRNQPDWSIEGQNGLIKHVMLNDRKRVLTLDTAGEVVMWDLLKCVPIRSYGKRHLEDVKDETTTTTTVANWCSVDTRTGSVAVTLEENTCFDAEMYADELDLDENVEFREDQRVNLGKWVLRYLFSKLITEEIRRDETYRNQLLNAQEKSNATGEKVPTRIQIPPNQMNVWQPDTTVPSSGSTLRPSTNGTLKTNSTHGLQIGLATPTSAYPPRSIAAAHTLSSTNEESASEEKPSSQQPPRNDYFSSNQITSPDVTAVDNSSQTPGTPGAGQEPSTPTAEGTLKDASTPTKEGLFGKKFRMNMSFSGMKKIGRSQANDKPAAVEEKDEAESDSRSSKTSNSRILDDNFLGTVQKIRYGYDDSLHHQAQNQQAHENGLPVPPSQTELPSTITPSLPSETPVLKLPSNTTILIQEERPEAGGVADLFEGTVGALGEMCDLVEKAAPMWLGEVLLRNLIPVKDVVKISFVLEPWQGQLTPIATDGNNRLNANRMLRAKKILSYVAEKIESAAGATAAAAADGEKERHPEDHLELWCQNEVSYAIKINKLAPLIITPVILILYKNRWFRRT